MMTTIKTNAEGIDGISMEMLNRTLPRTVPALLNILNTCLLEGCFPQSWKTAIVTPLPKKDQVNDYKDLRPISILPAASKILEKTMTKQLSAYLEGLNIIPENQSGFRKGRSTCTTLAQVSDEILSSLDQGLVSILILLDFLRAFDCIEQKLLLSKLKYYGLDDNSILLLSNYLSDRQQIVRCLNSDGESVFSDPKKVTRGCPQGACISPLLYAVYTADLPRCVQHMRCEMFADDTQLLHSFAPADTAAAARLVNAELQRVWDWARDNALCLNAGKTVAMIFGTKNAVRKVLDMQPNITLNGQTIEIVDYARNLGLHMDTSLNFNKHVSMKIKTAMYKLKSLYKVGEYLTKEVRRTLTESLILSQFEYCDIVYGPCLQDKTSRRIQRVQNSCVRFCEQLRRRDRITPVLNSLGVLDMAARRRLHLACFTYDVVHSHTPAGLAAGLRLQGAGGRQRAVNAMQLLAPRCRTAAARGSFRYASAKIWNDIPPPIRIPKTRLSFKTKLKKYLINQQKEYENINCPMKSRFQYCKYVSQNILYRK
ncbi:reverse transcriptase (RNA-dependent DNA polymerase) domain-containing protein [Phthorimaea operculella]|nr:reverse transcriptase (RNA-dependent DNA polymerase) domain-containing protein [Phthorimaea operculella]